MAEGLVGIIGGTGLGDALAERLTGMEIRTEKTPFGPPSGPIIMGQLGKRAIAFISRHGPGHRHCPSDVPFAANIFALKALGARAVIASGAVGSLRQEIAPGDVVVVDQFIDKTFKRPNTFFAGSAAVHCEMAEPTCDRLRKTLIAAAQSTDITVHTSGTYVCMEGPQFSTRAESLMHRMWGGDLIGMTAMPEAKLAREAQMCYALVALASDYDCWKPHEAKGKQNLLQEILSNLNKATTNCMKVIDAVLAGDEPLVSDECPCRKSLELAVWTKQDSIAPADKKKLAVLFE